MAHIVEIILINATIEHLDEVPHKGTVHQASVCGIVATDKDLVECGIISSCMLHITAWLTHLANKVSFQVNRASGGFEGRE